MAAARTRFAVSFLPIAASLFLFSRPLWGQQTFDDKTGTVTVNLRLPDGTSYERSAVVNLCTFTGSPLGVGTMRDGQVLFTSMPPGRYTVEVLAPGYQRASEPAEIHLAGERIQVYVMTPESTAAAPRSTLVRPFSPPMPRRN
jgi:hypothetical protein